MCSVDKKREVGRRGAVAAPPRGHAPLRSLAEGGWWLGPRECGRLVIGARKKGVGELVVGVLVRREKRENAHELQGFWPQVT